MAYAFGTSASVAAFLVSLRFAHLLRRVLGEGCLQSAFIPLFEELKREDPLRASAFFHDLKKKLTILLSLISLIAMGGLSIFHENDICLYMLIMMPSLVFICLYGLEASLLQCEGVYFLPSITPVAFNLLWMGGALALVTFPPQEAMKYLSGFIIGGSFLQWAFLVPKSRALLPKCEQKSGDLKRIIKPLFLGMMGVAATQINSALDAVFARFAESEGPAYLWYAIRIEQLPLALFGVALSSALLPPLTRAVKAGNTESARVFFHSAIKMTLIAMIPMTFALIVSGRQTVALLYERGDFTAVSTHETAICLWGYAIGLLPSVLILIMSPLFFAHGDYRTPARASCFAVILNTVLNFVGVAFLSFGSFWIAVATSIAAYFNAWMLMRELKLELRVTDYAGVTARALACSCVYAGFVYLFEGSFMWHVGAFGVAVLPLWYSITK